MTSPDFSSSNRLFLSPVTALYWLFAHLENKTILFLWIWITVSLYIQGNRTEIWVHLTILRIKLNQLLWTKNQRWGNIWVICSTSPQPWKSHVLIIPMNEMHQNLIPQPLNYFSRSSAFACGLSRWNHRTIKKDSNTDHLQQQMQACHINGVGHKQALIIKRWGRKYL